MKKTYQSVKLTLVREKAPEPYNAVMRSGRDCARLLKAMIGDTMQECFVALYLNSNHRMIALHVISVGSMTATLVDPKVIFAGALATGATAILVAHQHPTGDPSPSENDRLVTRKLELAAEVMDIRLLDHLVIGSSRFFSFSDQTMHPIE